MVGSVRNMSTTATNVSYEIGDGTGYIDARVWLDSADDDSGKTTGVEYAHFFLYHLLRGAYYIADRTIMLGLWAQSKYLAAKGTCQLLISGL